MSQIPNVNNASPGQQAFGSNNTLNELEMDDFLNLMIAELQNQDPLNPLDNADLIAQISQIREVGATEQLTQTLDSVLLGQNISSATNLIGADVVALNDEGQRVSGNVRVVSITDGQPRLDLAIDSTASAAGEVFGNIESGSYDYEVVWKTAQARSLASRSNLSAPAAWPISKARFNSTIYHPLAPPNKFIALTAPVMANASWSANYATDNRQPSSTRPPTTHARAIHSPPKSKKSTSPARSPSR